MAEEKKGFILKDRRIFSEDQDSEHKDTTQQKARQAETKSQTSEASAQLPQINFSTFIFSLNSSALVQFGLIEEPATGKKEKNLPLAKQTIDMLGMLEEKTRGNLTNDESKLLESILYDLRMIYVKETG